MSFNVAGLTAYTEENAMMLIAEAVAQGKISKYANLQDRVKTSTAINILETDVVFQADGCARSASGTTTLTQRDIVPGAVAIHEDLCMTDLASKYTSVMLKQGLTNEKEEIPFAELYFSHKIAHIQKAIEIADWTGDIASGTANINKYDGLIKNIAGGGVDGNAGALLGAGVTITAANVISVLTTMAASMDVDVMGADDLKLFVGADIFLLYQKGIADGNYFHYVVEGGQMDELPLVGFPNITVVSTIGLNGLNSATHSPAYLIRASNIYVGVDLPEEESNDFRSWYDPNDRIYKVTFAFRRGINVAFPAETVRFLLT